MSSVVYQSSGIEALTQVLAVVDEKSYSNHLKYKPQASPYLLRDLTTLMYQKHFPSKRTIIVLFRSVELYLKEIMLFKDLPIFSSSSHLVQWRKGNRLNNFWAELFNPFPPVDALNASATDIFNLVQ